jgi:sugar lactone lactonase YvrE
MNEYLFPNRITRRDFIQAGALATAGLATSSLAAADKKDAIRIGQGKWTYTLDENWGKLPEGMKYGLGCGIVVDSKDRVYVTSRSQSPCVAIFDRQGKLLETWSKDFADTMGYTVPQVADTAHCIYWSKEGKNEFLYFTENRSTNKEGPQLGKRVVKTDLNGKVLYEIGNVAKATSTTQKFSWDNPTDVAVAPNGDIYIVDGYGSQRVSRFDKDFTHIKTIGGRAEKDAKKGVDAPHGTFNTCHGVWINTLKKSGPEVYIADRANNRVEVFSMELDYLRTLPDFKLPCCFYQQGGHIYVPELGGRVTIFDKDDKVVAQLGDGSGVKDKKEFEQGHPDKFAATHAMTVDSRGDFYVVEWLPYGRVRKFKHTAA